MRSASLAGNRTESVHARKKMEPFVMMAASSPSSGSSPCGAWAGSCGGAMKSASPAGAAAGTARARAGCAVSSGPSACSSM
ncbi:hypothetical protein RD18_16300 [Bordetella pertussis]|nr:hypothetical protein RD18_16300 [Bordetella pertussis]AOY29019.1 hypothetical protein BH372_17035 [Bordetella pertussis]AOY32873.1 hypothetical protein BH373_17650 [Bordetella pertussis]AQB43729.1 hypothetical protein WU13_03085 [Bordetella pertussis]AQB53249.1 hypothetical protein WU15_16280 [Bordetella pertussis]